MNPGRDLFLAACAAPDLTDHLHRLGGGGLHELHSYLTDKTAQTSITGQMLGLVMLECAERYLGEVTP